MSVFESRVVCHVSRVTRLSTKYYRNYYTSGFLYVGLLLGEKMSGEVEQERIYLKINCFLVCFRLFQLLKLQAWVIMIVRYF